MEIAGKTIPWQSIVEAAGQHAFKRLTGNVILQDRYDVEYCEDILFDDFESEVWKGFLNAVSEGKTSDAGCENAVAAVIRHGLDKKNVRFKKDCFRLILPNRRYLVRKDLHGFSAGPYQKSRSWCSNFEKVTGISADVFAELILGFDALIPEIESAMQGTLDELRQWHLKCKRERMAHEMTLKMVKALIDEYLSPLQLKVEYSVNGNMVNVYIEQTKSTVLKVPVEQLADRLKDTTAILNSMKVVDVKESSLSVFGLFRDLEELDSE